MPTIEETAYHEAGHVVAKMQYGIKFDYVTIIPKNDSLGHVRGRKRWGAIRDLQSTSQLRYLVAALAGLYAQKKFSGRLDTNGADSDFDKVDSIIFDHHPSDTVREAYRTYIHALAETMFENPIRWRQTEAIANALLERKTLTYQEASHVAATAQRANW